MKEVLEYLLKNITGSENFTVNDSTEDGKIILTVEADPEIIGLIIGKQGKTIKNIRRIVAIKGALEKKAVNISVTERV